MEKVDYSKYREVMIADGLPMTFVGDLSNDISSVFEKHNIKTLEDLFVAYENGVFNDKRRKYYAEIKGQTELLLSYYTNAPLVADDALNRKLDFSSRYALSEWYVDRNMLNGLYRCGITLAEYHILFSYAIDNREKIMISDRTETFLSIINRFANDKGYQSQLSATSYSPSDTRLQQIQNIIFKSKIYEKHLQSKNIDVIDSETIRNLQEQMQFLLRARDNLDAQIALVQNQLSNVKNAGGIRR